MYQNPGCCDCGAAGRLPRRIQARRRGNKTACTLRKTASGLQVMFQSSVHLWHGEHFRTPRSVPQLEGDRTLEEFVHTLYCFLPLGLRLYEKSMYARGTVNAMLLVIAQARDHLPTSLSSNANKARQNTPHPSRGHAGLSVVF